MYMADSDASWDADYDLDEYPTAKRPDHWLSREQVQNLIEETQLKMYLEKQNERNKKF